MEETRSTGRIGGCEEEVVELLSVVVGSWWLLWSGGGASRGEFSIGIPASAGAFSTGLGSSGGSGGEEVLSLSGQKMAGVGILRRCCVAWRYGLAEYARGGESDGVEVTWR